MIVTKEGIYKDARGIEYYVLNVNKNIPDFPPYYRAYFKGGYYNVNKEPNNAPFDEIEIEMVEFVRDLEPRPYPMSFPTPFKSNP